MCVNQIFMSSVGILANSWVLVVTFLRSQKLHANFPLPEDQHS